MSRNKIFKATFIVMAMTILSKVIGFARDILAAYHFGVEDSYDIYVASVSIPESVFMIVGLAISTTFIPMLSEVKHSRSKEEMFDFSNNIINILSVISILVIILGLVFTKDIVGIFVPNFGDEKIHLTILLTRITIFNIILLCVNACFASILQVCEDFVIPALLGIFFNVPIIIYLLLFRDVSVVGLAIANVLGNLLRVIVQIPSLYKNGYRIKLKINLNDEKLKIMMVLIIPVIIGAGANSINMLVDKSVASGLVTGSMAALEYSQRIIQFANTAITTSLVSVVYPLMANRLNEGDKEGFLKYLSRSIVIICLFLIPITFGVIFLSDDIVKVIYERGRFDSNAVILTSMSLLGYAIQLPFAGIRDILNSSLFSMKKTKVTAINGIVGVFVNIVLSITLSKFLGVLGIAIATSISAFIISILLLNSTRRLIGSFNVKELFIKVSKITISSLIMIIVLYYLNKFILIDNSFLIILLDASVGAITFFILCKVFKIEEFEEFLNIIEEKFGRRIS
ncbi:murein biosynthesis integral membrane protein MurJ [Clostridium sp. AL.422]|uniref:murein biosynthesis integral membrane protein MurJ n=1 Tax=Clostridium TaxID=1485 RepID=UPI00293DF708|nr:MULTISPECIES: murein biosynthesis integral membrane protein MurJ [unclassified Clostridium]MDV4150655.1 murein biosynthesis integral membrane protein MurJ [Clostridium sp. AL.422]